MSFVTGVRSGFSTGTHLVTYFLESTAHTHIKGVTIVVPQFHSGYQTHDQYPLIWIKQKKPWWQIPCHCAWHLSVVYMSVRGWAVVWLHIAVGGGANQNSVLFIEKKKMCAFLMLRVWLGQVYVCHFYHGGVLCINCITMGALDIGFSRGTAV